MHLINTKRVLITGFSSIVIFMVLIAVFAIGQMRLTFDSVNHIVKNNNTKTTLISIMLVSARERTISLQKMMRIEDPFTLDEEWMRFNSHGAKFAEARKQFIELGISKEERAILELQGAKTNEVAPIQSKIADMAINGDIAGAEKLLNTVAIPGQNLVFIQLYNLLHLLENESNLTVRNVSDQLKDTERNLMIAIVITLFGSIIISIIVTRRISSTEKKLSREKERAQVTLNSIGDAVITTDENGNVTNMNPVAEHLTGWTLQEAYEQPLQKIFPILDATTREPIKNPVEKVIAIGETIFLSNHTTLIARDGTEVQIADSAAPIRDDKNILGMILVFNDVTEQYNLREAAAKSKRDLNAILDNSPAVVYVKDLQGRFTFVNKKFEELFDVKGENIIGNRPHEVFSTEIADQILENDDAVLSTGETIESERVTPFDDGLHTYTAIKFPLYDEDNKIYAVCGISTDITERKRQDDQLRHSQKMDALGKLTGGIAHDYNNMLGVILGYTELLEAQLADNPKLQKYAQVVHHAADRGTRLTQQLLAFTRHKARDANELNINELLQKQRLILEKTLTARIHLTLDLADNLWPVWLDSGDLEDAIINMSINAMHAINGNGHLTLCTRNVHLDATDAARAQMKSGDYVLLSVTDTGSGMDETTKNNIFDPFFSTKGEQGTGLGLSQVYGLMERSGGAIKVYSEPGHGTRFALYFPRSDMEKPDSPALENDCEKHIPGHETLLVVDDEPDLVILAQEILSAHGYRVLTAGDGTQALDILKNEKVDLIISDVIMPDMNGYELAAKVQKKYPHIKIQMVSGFADDRLDHMANNDLHQNQLYKPYTSASLLKNIRRLLDEDNDDVN